MRKPYFALLAAPLLVTACQEPGQIFATDSGVAEAQGKLATDPAQAALWQEAAGSGAAAGIESVPVPKEDAVSTLNPPAIADTSAAKGRVPFDSSVTTGVVIVEAPQNLERYSGSARVQSVEGEFLTLDLGDKGTLVVQAKSRGRAAAGGKRRDGAGDIPPGQSVRAQQSPGPPAAERRVVVHARGESAAGAAFGRELRHERAAIDDREKRRG